MSLDRLKTRMYEISNYIRQTEGLIILLDEKYENGNVSYNAYRKRRAEFEEKLQELNEDLEKLLYQYENYYEDKRFTITDDNDKRFVRLRK